MHIAGIVLAGGQSSRMGSNKALLPYRGRPLVEHMSGLLKAAGCEAVYIAGAVPGYDCIADAAPNEGPGRAIANMLAHFHGSHGALLFVPVDMPLLTPALLSRLMHAGANAHFREHQFPALLKTCGQPPEGRSVFAVIEGLKAAAIDVPAGQEDAFANINTKDQWDALQKLS
jgi:molybdopterin-guanine dinucleotide biosynthesis protein A